jgi:hypothetical protein
MEEVFVKTLQGIAPSSCAVDYRRVYGVFGNEAEDFEPCFEKSRRTNVPMSSASVPINTERRG